MKQEITEKQEAYLCVCFLLKKLGYKEGSRASVVIFDDDYIYDEDPENARLVVVAGSGHKKVSSCHHDKKRA